MSHLKDNADIIWSLVTINSILFTIVGFLIKGWMNSIKEDLKEQKADFKQFKEDTEEEVAAINLEVGKRKGEIELVKKDVEKLASDTLNNFENVKLHLTYQKTALDDIKSDAKDRKQDMDTNFKNLIELITNKGKN